jgi:hypothetical protein
MKLMMQVDQHQLKVGGKWAVVIEHVKARCMDDKGEPDKAGFNLKRPGSIFC